MKPFPPLRFFDSLIILVKMVFVASQMVSEQRCVPRGAYGKTVPIRSLDLPEEFDENDSEIETVARECIAATVAYILEWFGIPIPLR